jgi:hypothetical protein
MFIRYFELTYDVLEDITDFRKSLIPNIPYYRFFEKHSYKQRK